MSRVNDALSIINGQEEEPKPQSGWEMAKSMLKGFGTAAIAAKLGGTAGVQATGQFFNNRAAQQKQAKLDRINKAKMMLEGEKIRTDLAQSEQSMAESKARMQLGQDQFAHNKSQDEANRSRQRTRDLFEDTDKTIGRAQKSLDSQADTAYRNRMADIGEEGNRIDMVKAGLKTPKDDGINIPDLSTPDWMPDPNGGISRAEKELRAAGAKIFNMIQTGTDIRALDPKTQEKVVVDWIRNYDKTARRDEREVGLLKNEILQLARVGTQAGAGYDRYKQDPSLTTARSPWGQIVSSVPETLANTFGGTAKDLSSYIAEGVVNNSSPVRDVRKDIVQPNRFGGGRR